MLHIHIPFESSWTNSFADQDHDPLFTSGSSFGDANRGATSTTLPRDAAPNTMRVESVRALNRRNPEMAYRVPDSYDNTVKGVLARLLGEVRRLRDLESDHLVNQLVPRLSYEINVTSEHDEIVSLATPPNAIQSSGAGLLPPGNPLYERSPLTEHLFGHLGLPLAALLEQGLEAKGTWVPGSPLDLVLKLDAIKDAQTALAKAIKKETGLEPDFMRQFALRLCAGLQEAQKLQAAGPSAEHDKWNVGGALLVAKLHMLSPQDREALCAAGALTARGNLGGLAMSGHLGNATIKDVFSGAGCKKAFSTRMPYATDLWFEPEGYNAEDPKSPKKMGFKGVGVIKKSGVLRIQLDLPSEQLAEVRQRIADAGVGTFHFGKKGLAYVGRIYEN